MTEVNTRDEVLAWLEAWHASSKQLDADRWLDEFFTNDITMQYGNLPQSHGPEVRQMFKDTFAKFDMMTHEILYFDVVGDTIYQSTTIRYLIKGDDPAKDIITIPGFAVLKRRQDSEGAMRLYRAEVYLDPSPVFHRIHSKFGST